MGVPVMSAFRVSDIAHERNPTALLYHVYAGGQRRGLIAARARDTGSWSVAIVGVTLAQGLPSADALEDWLAAHINLGLLQSLRPIEQEV